MALSTPSYYQSSEKLQNVLIFLIFLIGIIFLYFSFAKQHTAEYQILMYFYLGLLTLFYSGYLIALRPSYSVEVTEDDITILKQRRFLGASTNIIHKSQVRKVHLDKYSFLNVSVHDVCLEMLDGSKIRVFKNDLLVEKYNPLLMHDIYLAVKESFQ